MMRDLNKISRDKRDGLGTKEENLALKKVKSLLERLDHEGNERCNRRGEKKWSNVAKGVFGEQMQHNQTS